MRSVVQSWRVTRCIPLLAMSLAIASTASAGDWPQILGPQRNGSAPGEKVSAQRARLAWQAECGSGLAGVAVAEGIAVLFHRLDNQETLTAFEASTGKVLWKQGFPTNFRPQIINDNGPRAVPTIAGGHVYAYGAQGGLSCVELKSGVVKWTRPTHTEFQAPEGYFGAGSAPLVEGSRVIVNVGGPKGAGIVAFDALTGKTLWQSTDELASYAAPTHTMIGGESRILVITRLNFLGLAPDSGREVFRIPFGSRGPTVNGAIPVVSGDHALLTASYGIGARWVRLAANAAEVVWDDEVLSSQYTTPILRGKHAYGVDGRQDGGPIELKCFELESRRVAWTKTLSDYATLVATDEHLLVMQTNGELRVFQLDPASAQEIWTQSLARGTTRALPALADGRWFVRNESTLFVLDLHAER